CRTGVPVIHTEHSDHVAHARGWWNKLKNRARWRLSSRLAQRICCVSEDVARSMRRWGTVPASQVDVGLNGINVHCHADQVRRDEIRKGLGIPHGARVTGTVGRLVEVKRQDLLLRAFARLPQAAGDRWLLLVGDGAERSRLESLAAELGIRARAIFA